MVIYVSMTDRFMSGWGGADGATNRFVVICDDRSQADAIEAAAHRRDEMQRIGMSETKPRPRRGVVYSFRNFSDLSGDWVRDYRPA